MYIAGRLLAALCLGMGAAPAAAHHPGHELDEVIESKETYFQVIDRPAPAFTLQDADGRRFTLEDFRGKVVVLHFIYATCPDFCPLHAELIAEIQGMVNRTPMADVVRFISITTDPVNDTPEVLEAYGPARGLDPVNWTFLTTTPDQPEDATRRLALAFGHEFTLVGEGHHAHGLVTHVIDRHGRWRANFHGLRFEPVNLVLYLNGLTHGDAPAREPAQAGWWDRVRAIFQ